MAITLHSPSHTHPHSSIHHPSRRKSLDYGEKKAGGLLTDIRRLVRAVWTVLFSITAPAFGNACHLVFTRKLLGAAGLRS